MDGDGNVVTLGKRVQEVIGMLKNVGKAEKIARVALGILFGFLASFGILLRLKRENRKLKKSAKHKERELVSIRATPAQENY